MSSAAIRNWYLIAAAFIAVLTSAYAAWRYRTGIGPSAELLQLYGLITGILIVSWIVMDPQIPVGQRPSFDHGMLIWIAFPAFALYQMYSAHRWRGILIVLGLVCLLAAPSISLAVAHIVG